MENVCFVQMSVWTKEKPAEICRKAKATRKQFGGKKWRALETLCHLNILGSLDI